MPPQIKRLLLAFAVFIGLFIVVRHFLVPPSFGEYGHYRADSVEEVKALDPVYTGASVCQGCHPDIVKLKSVSRHAHVACETCHGPAGKHIEDPMSVKPDKPSGREFCGLCHSKNIARPKGIPQVDLEGHNVGMDCRLCHNPHNPKK